MARPKKATTRKIERLTQTVEELEAQAREQMREDYPIMKEMDGIATNRQTILHALQLHYKPEGLRRFTDMLEAFIAKTKPGEKEAQIFNDYFADIKQLLKFADYLTNINKQV